MIGDRYVLKDEKELDRVRIVLRVYENRQCGIS